MLPRAESPIDQEYGPEPPLASKTANVLVGPMVTEAGSICRLDAGAALLNESGELLSSQPAKIAAMEIEKAKIINL